MPKYFPEARSESCLSKLVDPKEEVRGAPTWSQLGLRLAGESRQSQGLSPQPVGSATVSVDSVEEN
jgi:hypothetical protein